tara:strand:- start:1022 stop:1228 length:207 start_codon:yes stop_codon:yes gene_type:complete
MTKVILDLLKNYTIGFFAGLVASLAVMFYQSGISKYEFGFWLVVLYFVGLFCVVFVSSCICCRKNKNG